MFNRILAAFLAILVFSSPALADIKTRAVNFGGDGRNGTVAISSNTTETAVFSRNYLSYTVNNGIIHTVKHGSIIQSVGPVTINGTLAVSADFVGGTASANRVSNAGAGPGGGTTRYDDGFGGGGGGNGGAGGAGGSDSANFTSAGNGGKAIGIACWSWGGGGSSGSPKSTAQIAGSGGAGAGSVRILSPRQISIPSGGTIQALGVAGTSGVSSASGGGGGAGGQSLLYSLTSIVLNGTINLSGGNGGNGVGGRPGAGGGGGGVSLRFAPSVPAGGTVTLAGGTAGTGETGMQNGGTGVNIIITDYPSIPLIGEVEFRLNDLVAEARANGGELHISNINNYLCNLPEPDSFRVTSTFNVVKINRRKYALVA